MIVASLLSILLCPLSLEIGDNYHEQAQNASGKRMLRCVHRYRKIIPWEFGANDQWLDFKAVWIDAVVEHLHNNLLRGAVLFVMFIIGCAYLSYGFSPEYICSTPSALPGHHVNEGPRLRTLFGPALSISGPPEAPADMWQGARRCLLDA